MQTELVIDIENPNCLNIKIDTNTCRIKPTKVQI